MPVRDAEATKARIFEAATEEFAAYGIAGARVDRIAQHAHANKQLIYAYFGDKERLFYSVLNEQLLKVAESVSTEITDLGKWVDEHIDYHRDHPELLRLLMWEELEVPKERPCRNEARAARYQLKKDKIAEAQAQGIVREDMPSAVVLMFLLGMVNAVSSMQRARDLVLGEDFDAEELRHWMKDAVKRIAARAQDAAPPASIAGD
jgi:AcrR family transcriptional regulator